MKVVDILKVASNYLNIVDELSVCFEDNNETVTLPTDTQKKLNRLLLSLNNVVNELFLTKFALRETYQVSSSFGQMNVNLKEKTGKTINKILRVYNVYDEDLVFADVDGEVYFKGNGGKIFIDYTFVPPILSLNDDVKYLNGISSRILALGVASEYLNLNEIYDDAENFREQFESGLSNTLQGAVGKMPIKRWL